MCLKNKIIWANVATADGNLRRGMSVETRYKKFTQYTARKVVLSQAITPLTSSKINPISKFESFEYRITLPGIINESFSD